MNEDVVFPRLEDHDDDDMLSTAEVAWHHGVETKTLQNWVYDGKYPQPDMKTGKHGRWYFAVRTVRAELRKPHFAARKRKSEALREATKQRGRPKAAPKDDDSEGG